MREVVGINCTKETLYLLMIRYCSKAVIGLLSAAVLLSVSGCFQGSGSHPQNTGIPVEGEWQGTATREDYLQALQGDLLRWNVETEQLEPMDGDYLKDKDYLVLYFAASWCPACKWFGPTIERFYQRYQAPRSFEVILIGNDRDLAAHENYVARLQPSYPVLRYDAELESEALSQFAERLFLPGLRVIDRQGNLVLTTEPSRNIQTAPERVLKTLESWLKNTGK